MVSRLVVVGEAFFFFGFFLEGRRGGGGLEAGFRERRPVKEGGEKLARDCFLVVWGGRKGCDRPAGTVI